MDYITGIYALNLAAPEGTPGDWHHSCIDWERVPFSRVEDSPFGDWGIYSREVTQKGRVSVANHLRACVDLIADGQFSAVQGMRENFIDDDTYDEAIFEKVLELRNKPNWDEIDIFMGHEYMMRWIRYKENAA